MRDPATGNYLLDVFCEPHDGDAWMCRGDEKIRLTDRDIIHHTHYGIPFLAPSWSCCSRPSTPAGSAVTR